jgi:hypothetical protein
MAAACVKRHSRGINPPGVRLLQQILQQGRVCESTHSSTDHSIDSIIDACSYRLPSVQTALACGRMVSRFLDLWSAGYTSCLCRALERKAECQVNSSCGRSHMKAPLTRRFCFGGEAACAPNGQLGVGVGGGFEGGEVDFLGPGMGVFEGFVDVLDVLDALGVEPFLEGLGAFLGVDLHAVGPGGAAAEDAIKGSAGFGGEREGLDEDVAERVRVRTGCRMTSVGSDTPISVLLRLFHPSRLVRRTFGVQQD